MLRCFGCCRIVVSSDAMLVFVRCLVICLLPSGGVFVVYDLLWCGICLLWWFVGCLVCVTGLCCLWWIIAFGGFGGFCVCCCCVWLI